jgi:hypothetical protein
MFGEGEMEKRERCGDAEMVQCCGMRYVKAKQLEDIGNMGPLGRGGATGRSARTDADTG